MARNTFTVAHEDGRTETKTTVQEFTHAVVGNNKVRDSVRAWCGSRALAEKEAAKWAKNWFNVRIVEVNRGL